eukprot:gnl/TRDRNA2_/TRDRNA2_194637_c0_seq1.p1 gnl/TRDRNA2_/TRDRNA2_194637_c0~~gnl/TRDRNA2_/TRDRNA2_194637_c0_seq1.p1  ORF type:complete len:680 (+),score=111.05 gnl/TRDRNA2_/TRDRNA2_194637_c0_seq1:80-2041(+)
MADDPVDSCINVLRTDCRSKLLDLLDELSGRKVLVLDASILGLLDLLLKGSDLRNHGIEKWYKLTEQCVTTDCLQMIFLVRCGRTNLVDWIAKQIHADEAAGIDRLYVVIFVPRKTNQDIERLGRGNVRANVRILEYELHLIPFDNDIVSMEMPHVLRDYHVNGNPSSLFYAAKAMMYLQSQFGVIPALHAIGGAAKCVVDIMLRLRKEQTMTEAIKDPKPMSRELSQPGVPPIAPVAKPKEESPPKITECILIDRRVDLYSVLCSQFTYQALIDIVLGISNNRVDISQHEWAKDRAQQVRLSSDDPLYAEMRDLHIDKLGPLLQQKAMDIQETYKEKESVKDPVMMASYIKKFKVAQMDHQTITLHVNIAHHLKTKIHDEEYGAQLRLEDGITAGSSDSSTLKKLEDYIDDQKPMEDVLRLLCLYSLVNNGVRPKQLDALKRQIIQSYGYEHLLTLCNMEKVGMLSHLHSKSVWPSIKRQFNLFVEDSVVEKDISFAYSGYAPLSVRLVQMTRSMPKGWRGCQDALSNLYGPAQEHHQTPDPGTPAGPGDTGAPTISLILFLGGVTHGELAALRRLTELEEGRRRFLICTTEFLNPKKLFESMKCEMPREEEGERPPQRGAQRSHAQDDRKGREAKSEASRGSGLLSGFMPG